ncbi:unnamed protein product, partial [Amoebophrya sp. A120]|eukprot:GSA120T00010292001.1
MREGSAFGNWLDARIDSIPEGATPHPHAREALPEFPGVCIPPQAKAGDGVGCSFPPSDRRKYCRPATVPRLGATFVGLLGRLPGRPHVWRGHPRRGRPLFQLRAPAPHRAWPPARLLRPGRSQRPAGAPAFGACRRSRATQRRRLPWRSRWDQLWRANEPAPSHSGARGGAGSFSLPRWWPALASSAESSVLPR